VRRRSGGRDAELDRFLARACALGALEAKVIDPASIVTAAWVRLKCQYGCGGYGSSLCCPPYTPTPEETRRIVDCYERAVLVHCEPGVDVKRLVATLEREVFLEGFYKAFGLGSGPCSLCDECNFEGCIHPYEARPSMEACGIDVYATARGNGYPIEVVTDESCDQNYYGVVLVD
jgi:predicted metal-binding protein